MGMPKPPPFPKQEYGEPRGCYEIRLDEWARQVDAWGMERHRRHIRLMFWIALIAGLIIAAVATADTIKPADLDYQGVFRITRVPGDTGPRFGYGVDALAFEGPFLIASSHRIQKAIGRCTIPDPVVTKELAEMNASVPLSTFAFPIGDREKSIGLDRVGGVVRIDDRIFVSLFRYYAVQPPSQIDDPTLLSYDAEFGDRRGLWKIGPYGQIEFHQKRTSNYLAAIPRAWADAHVGGKRLAAGKADGAGNSGNSHGPSLVAVDHRRDPEDGGVVEAQILLQYPPDSTDFADWSPCDRWEGLIWVENAASSAVIFAGRRGRGDACYGSPADCGDPCGGSKGYHCAPYEPEFVFYDPADLAKVAAGEIAPNEVRPYASRTITEFLPTCHFSVGGMAYDEATGRVFLAQSNGENTLVHVWRISGPDAPPPDPPAPPTDVSVTVEIEGRREAFTAPSRAAAIGKAVAFLGRALADEK